MVMNVPGDKGRKAAGLCGVSVPIVALSFIFVSIQFSPWFRWSSNALSDVGVGEAAWVFNSGLMVSGILTCVLAAALFLEFKGQTLRRIGAALLLIDAAALFGIGLFSEAYGAIHFYFSVAFFAFFPVSLFVLGAGTILAKFLKFGIFTIIIGILAALPWAFSWSAVAVPEMLSAIVASAWSIVQGMRLYIGVA